MFGIIPAKLSLKDLKRTKNIMNIAKITKPSDLICDENNDESILLYKTINPFIIFKFEIFIS